MTGGWKNSPRRSELPKDWHKRRAKAKKAANGMCQWPGCDQPGTDADHAGDRMDHDNIQWLCRPHHQEKTKAESLAGRQLPEHRRPPEPHPGALKGGKMKLMRSVIEPRPIDPPMKEWNP